MAPTKPFAGPLRKLVLAFDVGTTFSGIGYAILDPGVIPKVQAVTRFPGQENGDFKIPSILYYTQDGKVHAAGAEAAAPLMKLEAEDLNLVFVQWFKLHLRPRTMGVESADTLYPLPHGRTVLDIFSDFLSYLFTCARTFIVETHANGQSLWDSVQGSIDFVLSHPNGWEGLQQSGMRRAAVLAGLIPDNATGHGQVHFVTEGEASFHYCLDNGLASDVIKDGANIIIIDAGGGTVDLSTYTVSTTAPISVEEITSPDCILQGSTRINVRALEFLQAKLLNSRYGNEEDIATMLEQFEKTTKLTFRNPSEKSTIKFGSNRDKDPEFDIRSGHLTLEGASIAKLFNPSVEGIIDAVRKQLESASGKVGAAFLVGGFAASPYLFSSLRELLKEEGLDICRPDNYTNKAVAEGAVSFFLEHFVTVRVTKMAYGSPHQDPC